MKAILTKIFNLENIQFITAWVIRIVFFAAFGVVILFGLVFLAVAVYELLNKLFILWTLLKVTVVIIAGVGLFLWAETFLERRKKKSDD